MQRRSFLIATGTTAIGAFAGCRPAAPRPADERRLLGPGDLRLVGSFRMPGDVDGGDLGWGIGLAHRRVNGQSLLFSAMVDGRVVELDAPRPGRFGDGMAVAAPVRVWGDITGDTRVLDVDPGRTSSLFGLWWDEPRQRLWWTFGDGYNATSATDPSVGWSTLDDSSGAVSPAGTWRFPEPGCKQTMGGVLALPRSFSDRYCPGRTMAAGFGGYHSIATVGPVSMGPALHAFDPAETVPTNHLGAVPSTTLVAYPFSTNPQGPPDRCRRDGDYRTEFDGWAPRGGTGSFSWTDTIWQSAVWVDLPDVHGLLYLPTMGNGRLWYEQSTLHAQRGSHQAMVYDPADLGRVATGTASPWGVQPARTWTLRHPGMASPLPGWDGWPTHVVVGAAFDPAERQVMIALRHGAQPSGEQFPTTAVHVYEVA